MCNVLIEDIDNEIDRCKIKLLTKRRWTWRESFAGKRDMTAHDKLSGKIAGLEWAKDLILGNILIDTLVVEDDDKAYKCTECGYTWG